MTIGLLIFALSIATLITLVLTLSGVRFAIAILLASTIASLIINSVDIFSYIRPFLETKLW